MPIDLHAIFGGPDRPRDTPPIQRPIPSHPEPADRLLFDPDASDEPPAEEEPAGPEPAEGAVAEPIDVPSGAPWWDFGDGAEAVVVEPCPQCGSLELWQGHAQLGAPEPAWRCVHCDPPDHHRLLGHRLRIKSLTPQEESP